MEIVPIVAFPPVMPSTDQVTEVLAVNCWVWSGVMTAWLGEIVTLLGGGVIVTAAEPDFVVSAELVAVTV